VSQVPLGVVFTGWFGFKHDTGEMIGGLGSTHWNDGPDTSGIIHTPYRIPGAIGPAPGNPDVGPSFYCSADPAVVSWQLEKMRQAGVSMLLYSWWGWGDGDLDGVVEGHPDQWVNLALTEMLDQIKNTGASMKVAVLVEPFTWTQRQLHPNDLTAQQQQMILDYLWDNYYGPYAGQMFQWDGNPLLVTFDPMKFTVSDARYTLKKLSSQDRTPQSEAEGWEWWLVPQQPLSVTVSDDGVVFPNHRFSEYYLHLARASYLVYPWRHIDPLLEEGVYEQQWQWLVDNRDQVSLVIVYSWNFYGELAQLEPSTLGSAPPEEDYVAKTSRYYQAFLAGEDVKVYPRAWMKPKELRASIQPISWDELGFESDDALDLFLKDLLRRAQDHAESYLGRTYTPETVPPAVKEVALRLAANMYNYLLKVRRGPLMQVGEFEVRLVDDSVFTPALRRDLRPFRTGRVLGAV
jgi:hypothetical protein